MESPRWNRLAKLFDEASRLEAPERNVFLQRVSRDDGTLGRELKDLLACHEATSDRRLDGPAESSLLAQLESEAAETQDPLLGGRLGPYNISELIGRGGFADVYLGLREDEFEQKVAIKVLRSEYGYSEGALRRFQLERQVLADLEHVGIARLLDGGRTSAGRPFLVMEYVAGETFLRYCDNHQLSVRNRIELFERVCDAVAYAHSLGVIHRDIKPSNIIVTDDGTPKLVDFGIAKLTYANPRRDATLTREGLVPLTPRYASPEQLQNDPIGLATDVYSLGVVLYECLAGRPPFLLEDLSAHKVEQIVGHESPPRPSSVASRSTDSGRDPDGTTAAADTINHGSATLRQQSRALREVDHLVLKCLRKEPERRYRSAAELADDLRRYLDGMPIQARADSFAYRSRKFVQRNKLPVIAVSLIAISLLLSSLLTTRAYQRERDAAVRLKHKNELGDLQLGYAALSRRDFPAVREILKRSEDSSQGQHDRGIEWQFLEALSRIPEPLEIEAHQGSANDLAIVPGRPWVVSVGDDDRISVWNTNTGQREMQFLGEGPFRSVAVSPQGRYFAAGQDMRDDGDSERVGLWNLQTREFLGYIAECPAVPQSLAFSPDGRKLAIGPRYEDVMLVSIPQPGDLHTISIAESGGEANRHRDLAFLRDDELLFPVKKLSNGSGSPISLATHVFSQDRDRRIFQSGPRLSCFAVSSDRRLLAAGADNWNRVVLFECDTGKELFKRQIRTSCLSLALSPNNESLAVGLDDGTLMHWNLRFEESPDTAVATLVSLELVDEIALESHQGRSRSVCFTDGGALISCGDEGKVKIWPHRMARTIEQIGPPETGPQFHAMYGAESTKTLVEFHSRELWLQDLDPRQWHQVPKWEPDAGFTATSLSTTGRLIARGTRFGEIHVYSVETNQLVMQERTPLVKSVHGLAISPDDRFVAATGSNQKTTLWEINAGKMIHCFDHSNNGIWVAFSPDGKYLACGGDFREILVFHVLSGRLEHSSPVRSTVSALNWHQDEPMLASGHRNGDVVLHELGKEQTNSTRLNGHSDSVGDVMFSRDGRLLYSASNDTTIRLWRVEDRQGLGALLTGENSRELVIGLAQSPDGRTLYAAVAGQPVSRCIKVLNAF